MNRAFSLLWLVVLIVIGMSVVANAQTKIRCGTDEKMQEMLNSSPAIKAHYDSVQAQLANMNGLHDTRSIITIPVVVHVVYKTQIENIPDAQIQSQISVLNEDYRRLNSDASSTPSVFQSTAADCEIEFCLAGRDPNGLATNGIDRVQTNVDGFLGDSVKSANKGGADPWPRDSYLNIWVCNLGGDLLGYALFPGGPANTDGVVIGYKYFGSVADGNFASLDPEYNRGRTATHEIGHWLNLIHIWGDNGGPSCNDSDNITDTPNQSFENFGCPNFPHTSCSNGPNGDMFMNYMDYTDDVCMNLFTQGQKTRMRDVFTGPRSSILNSLGCTSPITLQLDALISNVITPVGDLCTNSINPVVVLRNLGLATLTSVTINYKIDNGTVSQFNWTGALTSAQTAEVALPSLTTSLGAHTFTAYTTSPNNGTDGDGSNDSYQSNFNVTGTGVGVALPIGEGFQGAGFLPSGWSLDNPNNDSYVWTEAGIGAWGGSSASAKYNNFSGNMDGTVDAFITDYYNFTNVFWPRLKFTVAYAIYDVSHQDKLRVYYSTNCGATWNLIYEKFGTTLSTNGGVHVSSAFVPTSTQWRDEVVALDELTGSPKVQFRFENISGNGNNLYVDDINLYSAPAGIEDLNATTSIRIYPNPSTGRFSIDLGATLISDATIEIYNSIGQLVYSQNFDQAPRSNFSLDLNSLAEGVYILHLKMADSIKTEKIIITR